MKNRFEIESIHKSGEMTATILLELNQAKGLKRCGKWK